MTTETKILSKSARPALKIDGTRSTSFFSPLIQPRLTINQPNDIYEQEADAVAEKVMRMQDSKTEPLFFQPQPLPVTPLQRKCAACESEEKLHRKEEEEEEPVQLKPIKEFDVQRKCSHCEEEEEKVQLKGENVASGGMAAPSIVHNAINSGGQPLDTSTRNFMESRFGYEFGNVKIHDDPLAHQSSKEINALAYTHGDHVVFGSGQYQPNTNSGKQLLAHELTHVVQQAKSSYERGSSSKINFIVQKKSCNFYVYDSTEPTNLGTAWSVGATAWAAKARGGYAVGSSDTIEYMIRRILRTFSDKDCDCIEEIQFWSHGSPGNAMSISKTDDEITVSDFDIPGLDKYGKFPAWWDKSSGYYNEWKKWFDNLTWRQQLFLELRNLICENDAEIYYRSCNAFQGKVGQEFAEKSADFWRSEVIGHTKLIALTQPGRKKLKPGEKAYWPESEGAGGTEMKKYDKKPKKY